MHTVSTLRSRKKNVRDINTTDNTLREQAFDNSLQPNILSTVSNGRLALVNAAACKLLGYTAKELLTKSRFDIFDIREDSFKEMLRQRTAQGQSTAFVTAKKKNGELFHCEISSAVFIDSAGVEKAITTLRDMSKGLLAQRNLDEKKEKKVADNIVLARAKQKNIDKKKDKMVAANIVLAQEAAEARLAANNEWIKYIAKTSYDVMWDWDTLGGDIYAGESVNEVFGYTTRDNTIRFDEFCSCLLPAEKEGIESRLLKKLASTSSTWKDSFMLRRFDGSLANVTCRASIIRNEAGKAVRLIGAIQDVSQLQMLEKKLAQQATVKDESKNIFQEAARFSVDGIWYWNLLTNDFFLGEGFQELFGYPLKDNTGSISQDWSKYLYPADKKRVEKSIQLCLANGAVSWQQTYRFIKADGEVANVLNRASIIRQKDGKPVRMIGAMHDISKEMVLEERLAMEIKLKEKQITEAAEDAKNAERSDIGKELHDNINQLLGASRMYLQMAKKGGENAEMYISRSSEYTLTAIEEIRKLTKGLITDTIKHLGLAEAITNISRDIMETNAIKITCVTNCFKDEKVNEKFKLNVFRIVQEQLNNIIKHARAEKVLIALSQNRKSILLSISDDGEGFDTSKKQEGIGIANIKSRAAAYNGLADFVSYPGKGCVLSVSFPVAEVLFKKA